MLDLDQIFNLADFAQTFIIGPKTRVPTRTDLIFAAGIKDF